MTFGMQSVDAPIFDLREILIFRNRFHIDRYLIVDDIIDNSSSIDLLLRIYLAIEMFSGSFILIMIKTNLFNRSSAIN